MLDTHNHEGKSSAHYPMNIVGKGLGALVLGVLVVGCRDIPTGARTIYHDDESFVRLVPDLTVNEADPSTHQLWAFVMARGLGLMYLLKASAKRRGNRSQVFAAFSDP